MAEDSAKKHELQAPRQVDSTEVEEADLEDVAGGGARIFQQGQEMYNHHVTLKDLKTSEEPWMHGDVTKL